MFIALEETKTGSPPYTWGALKYRNIFEVWKGITPIYMGSTGLAYAGKQLVEDHPHIHGEHKMSIPAAFSHAGSPPYTCGAPIVWLFYFGFVRITPIYMGSTHVSAICNCFFKDHPHIHGEHLVIVRVLATDPGSPPYTWGAPTGEYVNASVRRITPIYMGSTQIPIYQAHP